MRKIGTDIERLVLKLSPDDGKAKVNMRAQQVRSRYKAALESVYKTQAALFLDHTNNVYIMNKNGVKTLIVYVDDSIFAAELNAQRELIKLKLLEMFGEDIEDFVISVSRRPYRDNHPFREQETEIQHDYVNPIELDQTEREQVSNTVSTIEDQTVKNALEKAMTADLEWKKGQKRKKQ